jgi:NAD(P)-dependent dehydrogenase (short-subunit alcohol dehydrogenase family)
MILQNKFILITGAGGGIGSVVAKKLASEGAVLGLVDISESLLSKPEGEIKKISGKSYNFIADITKLEDVKRVFTEVISVSKSIDVLINIAGIQAPIGPFIDNDLQIWKKNIEVNLLGTVFFTYYAIQSMKQKKRGKIINFSGGGSTSPRANLSAYAVAKTGVVRFTETIAEELKEYNIDVNAVAPGAINTKMLDEIIEAGELAGKEYNEAINRKDKGGTDPNLVAELICFLASDTSNGITGKLISAPWDPWQKKIFRNYLKVIMILLH